MLTTIIFIIISVSLFGILFFFFVKNSLKKRLRYLMEQDNKKNRLK